MSLAEEPAAAVASFPVPASPYKGLVPFEDSDLDAMLFFGRETECEIVRANLMAHRLAVLYGPSGVGKSSVLRAGVVHRLRRESEENLTELGEPGFAVAVFSEWRRDPITGVMDAVEAAVTDLVGPAKVGTEAASFVDHLRACADRVGGRLYIVLDQMEEYALYHAHDRGEGSFAVEFPRAVERRDLPVAFLLSLREDALASLDAFKRRIPTLFGNLIRLDRLDYKSARAAIREPIGRWNELEGGEPHEIEDALVDAVLEDVSAGRVLLGGQGRGGAEGPDRAELQERRFETPYLQLVMLRLWEEEMKAGSRMLQRATLQRLGGAERIIRTHLDSAMSGLSPKEQKVVARAFRYLVTPSNTKIAYTADDLAEYAEVAPEQLRPVLERLAQSDVRILRPVVAPGEARAYEIFHDALASAVLDWRERYLQRRRRRRIRALVALSTLFALAGVVGVSVWAFSSRGEAALADQTLMAVARGDGKPLPAATFSPDSTRIATAGEAGTVRIWDAATGGASALLVGHHGAVREVRFNRDGSRLLTSSDDGTVRLWDVQGHPLATIRVGGSATRAAFDKAAGEIVVGSERGGLAVWTMGGGLDERLGPQEDRVVAISADGRFAATIDHDESLHVWNVPRRRGVRLGRVGVTRGVFTPGGGFVVGGADGTVRVWSAAGGPPKRLGGARGPIVALAVAPDGMAIAAAGGDNLVRLWDLRTGRAVVFHPAHSARVESLSFSPDGSMIASASRDGTVRLWSAILHEGLGVLRGHRGAVRDASFDPSSGLLVTAGDDGTAEVWAVSARRRIVECALFAAVHADKIGYPQIRPTRGVGRRLPYVPKGLDTSSFVTWCYWQGGAPDPNGRGYDGFGNTETLLEHMRHIPRIAVRAGDLVLWHLEGGGHHVALVVEPGLDPLLVSHGRDECPCRITFSEENAFFTGRDGVTWLSSLP